MSKEQWEFFVDVLKESFETGKASGQQQDFDKFEDTGVYRNLDKLEHVMGVAQ